MSQKKYNWGLGIEHETALVHNTLKTLKGSDILKEYENTWRPKFDENNQFYKSMIIPNQKYPIMLFFNANPAIKELVKEKNQVILDMLKHNQLEPDFHDFSLGCKHDPSNKKWIQGNNCALEFVTRNYMNVTAKKAVAELDKLQKDALKNIKKTVYAGLQNDLYGTIKFPDLGAYRYVGYLDQDGNLKFSTNYFGSYHLNMTLPYLESETDLIFQKKHLKWAKLIQWIMPLLTAIYGSGDAGSFMDDSRLSEGSYRQTTNKFARPGTADLNRGFFPTERKLDYGSEWVTAIMTDLDYPYDPNEVIGTDFRKDPEKGDRFGFELRIFDHFPRKHLENLILLLWYLADHSHTLSSIRSPVNSDNSWKTATKSVIKYGWNAKLPTNYLRKLKITLKLPIKDKSETALNVYQDLVNILNKLYSPKNAGFYTDIIYSRSKKPIIEMPNPIPNRAGQIFFIDSYFKNKPKKDLLNKVLNKHLRKIVTNDRLVADLNDALGPEVLDEIDDIIDYLLDKEVIESTTMGWSVKKLLKI